MKKEITLGQLLSMLLTFLIICISGYINLVSTTGNQQIQIDNNTDLIKTVALEIKEQNKKVDETNKILYEMKGILESQKNNDKKH